MSDAVLAYEPALRAGVFLLVLSAMLIWEVLAARRLQRIPRSSRWPGNFVVVVLGAITVRVGFPLTAAGLALMASDRGWGLLNQVEMPFDITILHFGSCAGHGHLFPASDVSCATLVVAPASYASR